MRSGVYRQRNYDYTKRNPNGRVFYAATGAPAAAALSNGDGLQPFPMLSLAPRRPPARGRARTPHVHQIV